MAPPIARESPAFLSRRLHLHEDGSVEPTGRDANLQPPGCDRRQKQPSVLHDSHRGPEEEYDHRSDGQVTGESRKHTGGKSCFDTKDDSR